MDTLRYYAELMKTMYVIVMASKRLNGNGYVNAIAEILSVSFNIT